MPTGFCAHVGRTCPYRLRCLSHRVCRSINCPLNLSVRAANITPLCYHQRWQLSEPKGRSMPSGRFHLSFEQAKLGAGASRRLLFVRESVRWLVALLPFCCFEEAGRWLAAPRQALRPGSVPARPTSCAMSASGPCRPCQRRPVPHSMDLLTLCNEDALSGLAGHSMVREGARSGSSSSTTVGRVGFGRGRGSRKRLFAMRTAQGGARAMLM